MALEQDLLSRADQLAVGRAGYERDWREIADFGLPSSSREMAIGSLRGAGATYDQMITQPPTRDAARRRFDSTLITAIDRLSAGMESLVTPQSEKWHEQSSNDPLAPEPTDEEAKWYERLRDYQFAVRYTPMSGFANANQKYIRSIVAFGTGVLFTEEGFGSGSLTQKQLPCLYQYIPISQCLISVNAQNVPDTVFRRFGMSARQMVQKFGDKCSQKVRDAADDDRRQDTIFEIVHAVTPRQEKGSRRLGDIRSAPWASYYIETAGAHLIGESGFHEFPFGIGYWIQPENTPYGESCAMAVLDDVRGLNVTRRAALIATQQYTSPPLAVAHDGVMNRPNLNPNAINFGAIDANGRLKIQPIITAQDPNRVHSLVEDQRNSVREGMYNNLFQILIQNPQMTAHEAMLRAAEKGDLLGPNGVKIQQGYAAMSDREVGIFERKGAFRPGASLEAPASLVGKSFGARFTSTLDRMRQQKEGAAVLQTYQAYGQIAAVRGNPSIFDNVDDDKAAELLANANGMPKSILVNSDQRDAKRQAELQASQQAAAMQAAQHMAKTAKDAVPALAQASELAKQNAGGNQGPNVAPLPLPQLSPVPAPANAPPA